MCSWAEGYPCIFLHNHGEKWECIGAMRNGETQHRCSTKLVMYRVPPKEIQGSWYSCGSDPQEAANGSHSGLACLIEWQPIGGDQDH